MELAVVAAAERVTALVAHTPGGNDQLDPAPFGLAALGGVYALGAFRQARAGRAPDRTVFAAFAAGFAALVIALVYPIEGLAGTGLAWHMVQHLLLLAVAPPFLVAAQPAATIAWALPRGPRQATQRGWRRVIASTAGRRWYAWVAVSLVAYVAVMWWWHLPTPYDQATANVWVHGIEHLMFVGGASLFWWALAGTNRRREYGAGFLAVFVFSLSSMALGALLTFYDEPLYQLGHHRPHSEILQDQQIAGVLMWAYGGVATAVLAMGLFVNWLRWHERRASAPRPTGALTRREGA